MIIACLDDEVEGARKKGPERDWLRRRAQRRSYAGIITDLKLVAETLFLNERAALETNQHCFHRG